MNSTNADLYRYGLATGQTTNLTADNPGYDTQPVTGPDGTLAWLSMARDGYEADKNDIKITRGGEALNLTADWDGTVSEFLWSKDGKTIYFAAPVNGTRQLFSVKVPGKNKKRGEVRQITKGPFDVTGLVAVRGRALIAGRTDMNTAKELYDIDLKSGEMKKLTRVNDAVYQEITPSEVRERTVKTTDGKDMRVWVIYPPNFDPKEKYPMLLCARG